MPNGRKILTSLIFDQIGLEFKFVALTPAWLTSLYAAGYTTSLMQLGNTEKCKLLYDKISSCAERALIG